MAPLVQQSVFTVAFLQGLNPAPEGDGAEGDGCGRRLDVENWVFATNRASTVKGPDFCQW